MKRRLHKVRIKELSGVDRPAQEGAKTLLLKRGTGNPDDLAKRMFNEVLAEVEIEESLREALSKLWTLEDALRQFVKEVLEDPEAYPDPKQVILESLPQFATAVSAMVASAVTELETTMNETPKTARQGEEPLKTNKVTEPKKTNDLTVEGLQKSLEIKEKENEMLKAYGGLTDAEKTHYNSLSDDEKKSEFLQKSKEERSAILEELQKSDSIVYTSKSGEVFRKSDDSRLVKMAKQVDEDRANFDKREAEHQQLRLSKRADDELGNFPGDAATKVALLKAVESGIKDSAVREKVEELFKAGNEALSGSFTTKGTKESPVNGGADAAEKFETLVKKYREENKDASEQDAILAVTKTDEGQALYNETLS